MIADELALDVSAVTIEILPASVRIVARIRAQDASSTQTLDLASAPNVRPIRLPAPATAAAASASTAGGSATQRRRSLATQAKLRAEMLAVQAVSSTLPVDDAASEVGHALPPVATGRWRKVRARSQRRALLAGQRLELHQSSPMRLITDDGGHFSS